MSDVVLVKYSSFILLLVNWSTYRTITSYYPIRQYLETLYCIPSLMKHRFTKIPQMWKAVLFILAKVKNSHQLVYQQFIKWRIQWQKFTNESMWAVLYYIQMMSKSCFINDFMVKKELTKNLIIFFPFFSNPIHRN